MNIEYRIECYNQDKAFLRSEEIIMENGRGMTFNYAEIPMFLGYLETAVKYIKIVVNFNFCAEADSYSQELLAFKRIEILRSEGLACWIPESLNIGWE